MILDEENCTSLEVEENFLLEAGRGEFPLLF